MEGDERDCELIRGTNLTMGSVWHRTRQCEANQSLVRLEWTKGRTVDMSSMMLLYDVVNVVFTIMLDVSRWVLLHQNLNCRSSVAVMLLI